MQKSSKGLHKSSNGATARFTLRTVDCIKSLLIYLVGKLKSEEFQEKNLHRKN